ncbi:hypothetical protein ACVWW2_002518 [Bradyrhizobium sp. LM4.3]
MNSRFFSLAMFCTASPSRGDRHVDDQIDLVDVVPAPRDGAADVGLELVVADDDADRLAEHGAAEIVDRHLRRRHRTLAGRCRGRAVHVGEHADLDDVVGNLRHCGARQQRCRQERRCKAGSDRQSKSRWLHACPPLIRRVGRCCFPGMARLNWFLLQLFGGGRQRQAAKRICPAGEGS